jgi:hypothetical protein
MTTNLEDLPVSDGANIRLETNELNPNNFAKDVQAAAQNGGLQLPSRDIPQTQAHITQDEQTTANYIPEPPDPYIKEKHVRFQEPDRTSTFDELCDHLQEPILIGILYFIFQMPIVRSTLLKLMPPLFQTDGNSNLMGYLFNSVLFASAYYGISSAIEHMKQ